nr:uncharacterized protein LOC112012862 [Quercus suber]XP_023901007.1 uncharacterized protein LOC112012862 [Quercus suber]POE50082.1 hypothetical protein CFP56_60604 [Quercus suber]
MVQQTIESKFSEYGMGNSENDLPTHDKQLPVSVKKTVLRDLQNDNRIMVPNSIGNSPLLKDKSPVSDATKASGAKRASPEHPVSPPHPHSQSSNGHLVYVRRKSEAESGKSSTCDSTNITADCPQSRQLGHQDETTQPNSQVKEPKDSCFPAFAPFPMAASISSSGKPSVPQLLGKPGIRPAPAESNYHPVASAGPSLSNPKGSKNLQWEDRFHILQMLLRKLDEADQENYLQLLRSLSAESLSRRAVDLEKRSIQLSLEEAKELQRVAALNVLGKSMKNFKAPSTFQDRLEK